MSKHCARCDKTVYPIEELKCLDKVWHKGCFKCQECGMTLSMKTYKGFNKLPYCEAHIPRAKATTVAETPEMKRLAENTKIQSNVQYHADFEKNKAKFTQVADDPETRRIKQNTKIISNVSYHGDLERKAQMESKRSDNAEDEGTQAVAPSRDGYYQQEHSPQANAPPPQNHPIPHSQPMSQGHNVQHNSQQLPYRGMNHSYSAIPASNHSTQPHYQQHHQPQQLPQQQQPQQLQQQHQPQQLQQQHHHQTSTTNHMYDQRHVQPQSSAYYHKQPGLHSNATAPYNHHHSVVQQNAIQDANHNSPYSARNSQTLIYSSQTGPVQQAPSNRVGSIADYDPINDQYGSISQPKRGQPHSGGYRQEATYQGQRSHLYPEGNASYPKAVQGQVAQQHYVVQQHNKVNAPPTELELGRCYRAIYDYEAADTDEVSFRDGDLLTNCTSIDVGWMMGTVQRTAQAGMLPANYVERAF